VICLGLRLLAFVVGLWPWRALASLGRGLGWLVGSVLRIRRGHVVDSMRIAGVAEPEVAANAMYASLGRSALEFLWLARHGERALANVVVDEASRPAWGEALAKGRGVVVAATHTGNWDLAACAIARDVELLVVTKHLSQASVDRFWQSTRARLGVRLADASGAMARAREALGRGGAVAMMIDQVPASERHALAVEFLGRPALADRAPAVLAAAAGAPLVVAASRADDSGRQVLHVLAVLEPPARSSRGAHAWVGEATASSAQALDAFVRAHPSQWLWLHRRWRGVDPARPGAMLARRWSKIRSSSPAEASRAG
jgi:Kdo2-lipid IVA lauroyltransferase/acyltransferase